MERENHILVIGKIIKLMVKAHIYGVMEINMRVIGLNSLNMVLALITSLMVINIRENTDMVNHVVEANIFGHLERSMKVNLVMERRMVLEDGRRMYTKMMDL